METIRVLIVEDKLLIAEDIASRLTKHGMEVVSMCTTGEEALDVVKETTPDLILMDIQLAGAMDGISTAQMILSDQSIPIIYLSDFVDAATLDRAKKTNPANYLSKPFNEQDLIRSIDIAFTNTRQQGSKNKPLKEYVFLREKNQAYIKLAYNDILYLEADRAYCHVVTDKSVYTLTNNMNHVYEQLQHRDFLKVSRSYVVNSNRITSLNGNMILLGDKEVQMSKEYRDSLLEKLNILK